MSAMQFRNEENISTKERVMLEEAEKHGVSWRQIDSSRLFELTYQGKKRFFFGGFSANTTFVSYYACLDKRITRTFLQEAGVTIADGQHFSQEATDDQVLAAADALGYPVVLKSSHGNNGSAVYTNLQNRDDVAKHLPTVRQAAINLDQGFLLEKQVSGDEYRITLTPDKVLAIMARIPANVVGDGQHTIAELIEIKNQDPLRNINPKHDDPYPHVMLKEDSLELLKQQNLTADSVLEAGRQVFLKLVSNLSQGGDSVDLTDEAHPSVKEIALKAIQAIPELPFAGLDFMTEDLTADQSTVKNFVIEVNAGPHYSIHHYPMKGPARNVAQVLLYQMFPELEKV